MTTRQTTTNWVLRLFCLTGLTLGAALLSGACGSTTSIKSGETHFLRYCDQECDAGFDCRCGVCTKLCDGNSTCGDLADGVSCRSLTSGSCSGESICDLECTINADCKHLSPLHQCDGGLCRAGDDVMVEPMLECDSGCSLLTGYPEGASGGCVSLDAAVHGEVSPAVQVACGCGDMGPDLTCYRRQSDDSLWLLPVGELQDADAWVACSAAERERMQVSCDFTHCLPEDRPPSLCDLEQTCEFLSCGTYQYDERGCERAECTDDSDCPAGEYCSDVYETLLTGFLTVEGCGFGGGGGLSPTQRCRSLVPTGDLCDFSQDVRLLGSSSGGMIDTTAVFTDPYGDPFFIVNGQCEYWVSGEPGQVLTGTLSLEQAEALEAQIGWGSLPGWDSHVDESCPDAGQIGYYSRAGDALCSCGCDADAPAGLSTGVEGLFSVIDDLSLQGNPLIGDVRVLSMPVPTGDEPPEQPVPWPLAQDVASFAADSEIVERTSGMVVTGNDAQTLRELWQANRTSDPLRMLVETDDGNLHYVWVRDELPEAVESFFALVTGS